MIILGALAVAALWGATPVIHAHVFERGDATAPFVLVAGGIAYTACLAAYAVWHRRALAATWARVSTTTLLWIAAAAVFTGFAAHILYYAVLTQASRASHILAGLLFAAPLFSLLYAVVFLGETPTPSSVAGVLLVTAGVVTLGLTRI